VKTEEFYSTYLQYPQICTDSRKVNPGCLYFSLKGDNFNGNLFAADALAKGCSYAIVDDPSVVKDERYVLVYDVLVFLQDLASFHRSLLKIPVIGLTGTNGKTTTKELIHSVLKQKYRTVATIGNLNNHIGVPLTLLSTNQDTEILIVEMGANHPGEITFLCNIAKPTHGLITNIGKAHLEGFGSFEGVIATKNELYDFIKDGDGKLFANHDDSLLEKLVADYPCFKYGTSEDADVIGTALTRERFLDITWRKTGDDDFVQVTSQLSGGYNLYNILAALALGTWFGLTYEQINNGIESYVPGNMRSQWMQTGSNTLFLDAYNANPSSMGIAVEHFFGLNLPRQIVILGDMFELGVHSANEHLEIIRKADLLDFEEIIFVGPRFFDMSAGFRHSFFKDIDGLKEYLSAAKLNGCNILIKGSRGMQLEQLVDFL
jgi:UDP-N-acetylmuramoyl-tripeptide--D-alanyl-D-alanine ligase